MSANRMHPKAQVADIKKKETAIEVIHNASALYNVLLFPEISRWIGGGRGGTRSHTHTHTHTHTHIIHAKVVYTNKKCSVVVDTVLHTHTLCSWCFM